MTPISRPPPRERAAAWSVWTGGSSASPDSTGGIRPELDGSSILSRRPEPARFPGSPEQRRGDQDERREAPEQVLRHGRRALDPHDHEIGEQGDGGGEEQDLGVGPTGMGHGVPPALFYAARAGRFSRRSVVIS